MNIPLQPGPRIFRSWVLILAVVLLTTACSNGKVDLNYSFDHPDGTRYRWQIDSTSIINSSTERRSTRLRMEVEILEQIRQEDDRTLLAITLTPKNIRQSGQAVALPEPLTIEYVLDDNGGIAEVLTPKDGGSNAPALELGTLLARSRIPLPEKAVGLGGTWDTPLILDGQTGSFNLEGSGTLRGFLLRDRRRLAEVEIERSGEVTAYEQLSGALVELRGRSTSVSSSLLDIDAGVLLSSHSEFTTNFDMSRLEGGQLAGTLDVTLTSDLELQPE